MQKEKVEPKKKNTNNQMARVIRGFAPELLKAHYEEKQAEQSAKQPAEKIGCLQDKSAGSESRLRRGAVTEQSIK